MAQPQQSDTRFGGYDAAGIKATLYSAVLSDVLDEFGFREQAMRPFIRPLDEATVMFGRARTGLYMTTYQVAEGENPYEVEIALVDDLKPGDVIILACGGPTERIAPWGELLSTASKCRGAEGCITDGLVRDIKQVRHMGFPVFHGGIGPLDSKGRARMVEMDTPIECGGVMIQPGDLVFGDADGVVVIPEAKAAAILARAFEKVATENTSRDELLQGLLLRDVFERHGIL